MKIKYAKFINYAGIYAGTGKKKLILDFNDANSDITMLIGKNGSAKTTIQSNLNPMRESSDQRKDIILKGQEGYKEIHLEDNNDNIYIIKHYYGEASSKNKSYISKNGKELNDNGGIKLFYSILEKELNLTKDYFIIGKMGSDFAGFIGMSTSERKTYINKFVPNIDEYLDAYDIINEKFKSYNKDIKGLKDTINEINIDNLNIEKSNIENDLKKYNKIKDDLIKDSILLENNMIQLENHLSDLPDNFESEYEKIISDYNNYSNYKNEYFNKYPKLKNYNLDNIEIKLEKNNIELENINSLIDNNKDKLSSNAENIDNLNESINKIENQLILEREDFIDPYEIKLELNNLINDNKELSIKLDNIIYYLDKKNNKIIELLDKNELSNKNNEIKYFFSNIETIKAESSMDIIDNTDFNKEIEYQKSINNNNIRIQKLKNDITELNIKITNIENNKEKYDKILSNKPDNCVNSNCSFIKDALYFNNVLYPSLNNLLDDVSNKEIELENINKDNDYLNEKLKFIINIKKYIFNPSNDFMFLPLIINIKKDYNDIIKSTNIYEEKIKNISDKCNEYKSLKEQIEQNKKIIELKESIYKINSSKEKLINSYLIDKNNKENELTLLKEDIDILNDNIENSKKRIKIINNTNNLLNNVNEILTKYNNTKEKFEEYNKLYIENKNNLKLLNDYKQKLNDSNHYLDDINETMTTLNNNLEDIKNNLFLYETYSKKLKLLESDIQDLSLIKDCLDPKKGIPLIFMKNYLNSIAKVTNDLLDTAYNGDFKIKFKITSKEFLINVYKSDGTILNDISLASQGERSLTIISLSLAMLSVLFKDSKYDIIYLDEIDGPLDDTNRKNFLNIINSQLKSSMSQCFIISHNDEFYSAPVNLILLKNHNLDTTNKEIMENKTVIFDINN